MFKGFDLKITNDFFVNKEEFIQYKKSGKSHLNNQKIKYQCELEEYIENENIDGTKIQDLWFPQINADILISHSHIDKDIACALAGWLHKTFDLNCFIDSNVWGYSEKLLEKMNSRLSDKRIAGEGGWLYDYKSCNQVSQHVNTMLSVALQKMIDKTEAIILLNTENSIPVCTSDKMNETYSPWIYSEIICTQIVRNKPLIAYRDYEYLCYVKHPKAFSESVDGIMESTISYAISLTHLNELSEYELNKWKEMYDKSDRHKCEYPLDLLYRLKCPKEMEYSFMAFKKLSLEQFVIIKQYYTKINREKEDIDKVENILRDCWNNQTMINE